MNSQSASNNLYKWVYVCWRTILPNETHRCDNIQNVHIRMRVSNICKKKYEHKTVSKDIHGFGKIEITYKTKFIKILTLT